MSGRVALLGGLRQREIRLLTASSRMPAYSMALEAGTSSATKCSPLWEQALWERFSIGDEKEGRRNC